MAYNLPLQLLIQPPTQANLSGIKKQIESSLKGLNVDVVDPKNFAKTNAAIQNTSKQLDRGRNSADKFWDALEGKARGAVAYTIVNTALLKLTSIVSQATREAIKYETELLKISQVTGDSVGLTRDYSKSLVDISKKYNITLSKAAQLTRTLTQTGLSFREASKGAEILARTSLLATFDSLTSTTEGLIAVMQTFEVGVNRAGKVLESINAVSKKFAVESGDIVEAIRRTGGAFSTAGGEIEELIALFTSVRSTSRESAETIATGFRTIFGRLQRPKTIEYFKQLNIQLSDMEGNFIGPFQAIEAISKGLQDLGIQAGSLKFAEIVEQIGGIRQISRVVPLLQQFQKSQNALNIANDASVDSIKDVEKAQQGLGYQLGELNKEFGALISDIVNSPSFKFLAEIFINSSKAVIGLVSSLKPLLPILATVAAFKIGRGLTQLLTGGFSLKGAKQSLGFASGGMVPGSGNGDTVPAMLTPGEFVIRKSAVQAFGADRLANINKYAKGGPVSLKDLSERQGKATIIESLNDERQLQDNVEANLNRKKIKFGDGTIDWKGLVKRADEIYQPLKTSGKGSRGKNKKNAFYAAAKAFEESVQMITGGKLSEDPDAPVDIVKGNENIEVKFTRQMTDVKDLISKLYRQKFLTNSLPNSFTTGQDISKKKGVDIGDLTVMEMGEGEKAEFQTWYGKNKARILRKDRKDNGGIIQKFENDGEASGKSQKEFGQILLSEDGKNIEAQYNPNENRTGFVRTKFWKDNLYTVGLSQASKGYGPKLYDVAMEAITAKGGMLTSDRATVSGDARKVWDFYFKNRSDVKKTPLSRDKWTGNYALVDEKLRGPEDTWPPANDPAWALQTGYSKSPSLINDPKIVKKVKKQQSSAAMALNYFSRFANGGANTGTDTVPALLTPGEFVINKKSAQSFGYDNLHEINKYADGGYVDGIKVQKFGKGGKGEKAERAVSDERRKFLKEQARAKQDPSGLTRAGRREAGQLARGKDDVDFIAVQEKWTKYIEEETKNAKEIYQAKVKQIADEGGTIQEMSAAIKEYQTVVATIKNEAKGYQKVEEQSISAKNIKEAETEVKQKEDDTRAAASPAVKEVEKATKSLAQKITDGGNAVYNSLSSLGISYAEAVVQADTITSGLKNFAGFNVNQQALNQASVKGGLLSGASESVGKFADPKVIEGFGSQLNKVGKILPKSIGGPVRKLGGVLLKNGASIAKGAAAAAKGLNILSFIELGGGLLDALFSTDYGKQRDNLIALGDAAGAATAAAQAYSQEQYRAIPIIGGLLSAMGAGSGATEEDLDATGKLVVANARLEASLNGVDDEVKKAKAAFSEATALGDQKGQQDAINAQLDAAQTLKTNAEEVAIRQQAAGGASGLSVAGGAAGGALAGAAIGSFVPVIGTAFGALIGAVVGGATAWYMSSSASEEQIIKGYELSSEAIKKGAEIQISLIEGIGAQLENEAVKMVRSGGTFEDAIKKITEQVGEANMRRILDGRQLSGDPEADIKTLSAESQTLDTRITDLKIKQNQEEDDVKKQAMQTQIDSIQADKDKVDSLKGVLVQTQAAIIREKQLEERRQLQAKAMEYQIKLMKEMETAFDGFNASLREANNIAEEAANIGTGRLTTRQAAQMSGVGDSRLYEMDSSEIVRNRDVATQMATRVGMGTMRGQEIMRGQERVSTIDRIQGEVVNTGALSDILKDIKPGETADAKQIQDEIYKKLGLTPGADPVLDESIRQYSEKIAKDGLSAAGKAAQEAKEGATEQSKKIIEEQQKKDQELFKAQQQLREYQNELVQRNMQAAQQAYDNEKDYFDKRTALSNKVEDFLNPIKEGPGKAAAMQQRGAERVGKQRSALQKRRGSQFGEVGLGGQSLDQAVNNVASGFKAAGEASEQLKGQMDALLSTIQDEIQIEQDYLDTLIETAKAQQEYTQALNDAQGELVRNLVTGTEEEVADQLTTMNAAAVAAQQGSFAGIPEDLKKGVFSLFDQFGDIEIPGLGMTGRDAQREITKNELMRNFGYDEQTASQLASKAVKDKVPVDERMAEQIERQKAIIENLLMQEKALKDAQLAEERQNNEIFGQKVSEFAMAVDKMVTEAGKPVETPEAAREQAKQEKEAQQAEEKAQQDAAAQEAPINEELNNQRETTTAARTKAEEADAKLKEEEDKVRKRNEAVATIDEKLNSGNFTGRGGARARTSLQKKKEKMLEEASDDTGLYEAKQARDEAYSDLRLQEQTQRQMEQNQPPTPSQRPIPAFTRGDSGPNLFSGDGAEPGMNADGSDPFAPPISVQPPPRPQVPTSPEQGGQATAVPTPENTAPNTPEQPDGGPPAASPNAQAATTPQAQQGPIQVQTQGQQDITVRLPDIQGLVNQQITALVYETVGSTFNRIAGDVRSASNFEDVAKAMEGGVAETSTQNV